MATMVAARLHAYGSPMTLDRIEVPQPRPTDVLVEVKACGVVPNLARVVSNFFGSLTPDNKMMPPLPAIPGIELSGTVVAHGPNTAEPALGQPVFVSARDLPVRAGCYAEYIAVPARAAHPLPPGCSLEAAACLSNYQVAYHVLHTAARGVEAKRVLVHTAAGGVGSAAVQLALIAGLEVIGVAGSEKKTRAILGLSAQHAIDYRSEDVVARVRELTGGRGADLILDPIGGKGLAAISICWRRSGWWSPTAASTARPTPISSALASTSASAPGPRSISDSWACRGSPSRQGSASSSRPSGRAPRSIINRSPT